MRNTIPILVAVAALLVACHSPSSANTQTATPTVAPPPFQPMLITSLGTGTNTVSDGAWQVAVSETSLYLSRVGPGGTLDVGGWTTHTGWLVFIENDARVWAYDGDHPLWLSTATRSGNGITWSNYVSHGFPCPVPAAVYARLSEQAQKAIPSHD